MERIKIEKELLSSVIIAECSIMDRGIHVLLVSQDYGHVGAVSHMELDEELQTIVYPTHKEAVISEAWAKKLCEEMNCPVTVCCGIHYENITKDQIGQVLECTEDMLAALLIRIKQ